MIMIEHSYIKPRHQFGKQCIFEIVCPVAQENIWPSPQLMEKYIFQERCNRGVQSVAKIAAHEAQTAKALIKNTGMCHFEGGWPKEINVRDSEALLRYRRRIEKEDYWASSMRQLIPTMEHAILQNNAVNIYNNFFADMVPTHLVMEYNIRIRNAYEDPQDKTRPIKSLSWSPNGSNRLAAAYSFAEFEVHSEDVSSYSYVWDIENPNKALATLKSSFPLMSVEFNPHDPSLLVSGLMSGQVCSWDIRKGYEPVATSRLGFSHRYPAIQTLWTNAKSNAEFFSSSTNGTVMWWDTRFLGKPTEILVMDLDSPAKADMYQAPGVTALQFEQTISSRFLAGTENGMVVNVNRRGNNPMEKLAMRFQCHAGSVVSIDRNPAFTKNFLTVGDWAAKVWAEDAKEGCLLSTRDRFAALNGGCWSRSRCSVFFTINTDGALEAYDVLTGVRTPLASIHVSCDSLTAIRPHEDGEYLAVGSYDGNVYILECTEGLTTFTKEDKALLSAYFDRCNRYEKLMEHRMKELRLLYGSYDDVPPPVQKDISVAKDKKVEVKNKKKGRDLKEAKEKADNQKKGRRIKSKRRSSMVGDPVLSVTEEDYFRRIEAESAKFEEIDPADVEAAQELLKEREGTAPPVEETEPGKDDMGLERKSTMKCRALSRTRRKTIKRSVKSGEDAQLEERPPSVDVDSKLLKKLDKKKRPAKILRNTCRIQVCKPKICCKDVDEKRRIEKAKTLAARLETVQDDTDIAIPVYMNEKWYRRLTNYVDEIPERSATFKMQMLALRKIPPSVLREGLKQAKIVIRDWQERAIARKLCAPMFNWRTQVKREKKLSVDQETPGQEAMVEPKSIAEMLSFEKEKPPTTKKRESKGKGKGKGKGRGKTKLTQEELDKQQQEQQQQEREALWRTLKHKVKEHEPREAEKYPRISAAFTRTSSQDLVPPVPQ